MSYFRPCISSPKVNAYVQVIYTAGAAGRDLTAPERGDGGDEA